MEGQKQKDAHLLIVDDTPANVKLLRNILHAEGYRNITTMDNGRGVADYCTEHSVDLILLDLMMPGMDGIDVLRELTKTLGRWMPMVLVLTANKEKETCLKALQVGARDLITKPYSIHEVHARVHNLLEISLARKELHERNQDLEARVEMRTRQLFETRLEIISRLGRAAEYRDNETGLHTIRMSRYSKVLGLAVGMNNNDADLLMQAAPMHDIGKIGIPDSILLKPGKLDPKEWDMMKTHTTVGAEILSGSSSHLLQLAEVIALTHHEKWEGTGYPRGLKGEDIPLVGRIVAVADVFDALTTARPYKAAWPVEKALSFLKEQRERHFEGRLVDLFFENLPEILRIKEHFSESANEQGYLWQSAYTNTDVHVQP